MLNRGPPPPRLHTQEPPPPDPSPDAGVLIGHSSGIAAVRRTLQQYAQLPFRIRLEGERGTGKNRAAQWLHQTSERRGRFVVCSLASLSVDEGRQLGTLSGWKRGAFTGAVDSCRGVFERAHGGTLVLNELGLAKPSVQQVLMELLEPSAIDPIHVERLGEEGRRPLDVRLVFATNVDLANAVRSGTFRADLLDRIGYHVIELPPLRTRLEDIPDLSYNYLTRLGAALKRTPPELSLSDLDRLTGYHWPGNVRELENKALEPFFVKGKLPADLPRTHHYVGVWVLTLQQALERAGGNRKAAARLLGISRSTLYRRLRTKENCPGSD